MSYRFSLVPVLFLIIALPLASTLLVLSSFADGAQITWRIEAVDEEASEWTRTSVAVDASGSVHVVYTAPMGGSTEIRYAERVGNVWAKEFSDVGHTAAIAVDESGNPHISYWGEGGIRHAWREDGTWRSEIVVRNFVGLGHSIAVDSTGKIHMCYVQYTSNRGILYYALKNGASWRKETVDNATDAGYDPSITVDLSNSPHIGYNDRANSDVMYATRIGGIWGAVLVDGGYVSGGDSVAVDLSDSLHISYVRDGNLTYARSIGSVWMRETLEGYGRVVSSSIAVDAAGNPHIVFYALDSGFLYAEKRDKAWTVETLDDAVENVWDASNSLAIDSFGNLHATYSDGMRNLVKYARGFLPLSPPLTPTPTSTSTASPMTTSTIPSTSTTSPMTTSTIPSTSTTSQTTTTAQSTPTPPALFPIAAIVIGVTTAAFFGVMVRKPSRPLA